MTFKHSIDSKIRRFGLVASLSGVLVVSLAACGTTDTAVQPTPIETATTSATTVVSEATATFPAPVATETSGMMDAMTPMPSAVATTGSGIDTGGTATQAPSGTAEATTTSTSGSGGSTSSSEVQGTLREWAIDLSQKEIAAGKVRFTITNAGQFTHNFTVNDSSGSQLAQTPIFGAADGPQTLEVDLVPGTYTIICSLPGHAQRGQRTELVVK